MHIGLHYPNAEPHAEDVHITTLMGAESVKLLDTHGTTHSAEDMGALMQTGVQHFTVRLTDSLWYSAYGESYIPQDTVYAAELTTKIATWYERGVRQFQVDNEPNLLHTKSFGPFEYVWFMKRVCSIVREYLYQANLTGVKLVSPPLSFSPMLWNHGPQNPTDWTLDGWLFAYNWHDPNATDIHDTLPFHDSFDKLGANCYFQHPRQVRDPSFGASWYTVHSRLGGEKPVVVLEVASSVNELIGPDGNPLYTYEQAENRRKVQYTDWIYWTEGAGLVDECYFWIAPSCTVEWRGFAISEPLALVIGGVGHSSRRVGGRDLI